MGTPASPFALLVFARLHGHRADTAVLESLEAVTKVLNLPLTVYEASSETAGPLILGFNILEVPTVVVTYRGRKIAELTEARELTTKGMLDRLPKLFAKHDPDHSSDHPR